MKRTYTLLILLFASTLIFAQSPKWLKKARQAQVTVTAFAGNDIHQAEGFFVDGNGTVLTQYDVLKFATRAIVTTTDGKEYEVESIDGANSTYNVARLHIALGKDKVSALPLSTQTGVKGERVYILPRAKADKKALCTEDTITQIDLFNTEYAYYTLKHTPDERQESCPVLTEDGSVIALLQMPSGASRNGFGISATFANSLSVTALVVNSVDLRDIHIAKTMPEDEKQALTFIYLVGNKDKTLYTTYLQRFLAAHPQSTSAYTLLAEHSIDCADYESASKYYADGLKEKNTNKGELHYSWARKLYALNLNHEYQCYDNWNMERALAEIKEAEACDTTSLYTALEAQCLFALKRYAEARDVFTSLASTNMRSSEQFVYAAVSSQAAGDSVPVTIALLDSAIAMHEKPYPTSLSSALWMRGELLCAVGKYRDAVKDYNEYEHLNPTNLNANFYYTREQAEMNCRLYQQALNDIERAVALAPDQADLRAEEAAVNYRVGQFDEAIVAAQKATEIMPEYPDAYRILGVAYREKGNKDAARKALQKAVELGDTTAQTILENLK